MSARTARIYWRGLRGRRELNFNWPVIDANSVVHISASEFSRGPDGVPKQRFVGDASISVSNIRPHGPDSDPNHGVSFVVEVDWKKPLDVVTDITVMPAPTVVQPGGAIAASLRRFGFARLLRRETNIWSDGDAMSRRPMVLAIAHQEGRPPIAHPDAFYESFAFDDTDTNAVGGVLAQWGVAPTRLIPGAVPHIDLSAADLANAAGDTTEHIYLTTVLSKIIERTGTAALTQVDDGGDNDDRLTSREVLFLVVDSGSDTSGMNRWASYTHPDGTKFNVTMAFIGHRVGLMTAVHELIHSWGAVDLYGANGLNLGLTLMGSTDSGVWDDRNFATLDPWHRMALGMTRPRMVDLAARPHGSATLDAVTFADDGPALLLFDSRRDGNDCFLVELRTQAKRNGATTLDRGVPQGFVVWQVALNEDSMPYTVPAVPKDPGRPKAADSTVNALGSPSLERGSISTWLNSTKTPSLPWIDGSTSGASLSFSIAPGGTRGTVTW